MPAIEKLDEIVKSYESLKAICKSSKERIKREPSYASEIIHQAKRKKKIEDKRDIADEYFDALHQRITEHYILELTAAFERIIFNRLDNAYGDINRILTAEYEKRQRKHQPAPLNRCASSFIKNKEDIRNLRGACKILNNQLSAESLNELDEIILYRNWLSHGKRDVGQESLLSFEEIRQRFQIVLDEIK